MDQVTASIISAIITGLFSLWGVYAASRKGQVLIAYRLEELEKKVNKHNQLIERTYKLEGVVTELQHDIKELKGARS